MAAATQNMYIKAKRKSIKQNASSHWR